MPNIPTGLENPDLRCATNASYQVVYSSEIGHDYLSIYHENNDWRNGLINSIHDISHHDAIEALLKLLIDLNIKCDMIYDLDELTLRNMIKYKLFCIRPVLPKQMTNDFEKDGYFFQSCGAVYYHRSGDSGHYIAVVKRNNQTYVCNDRRITPIDIMSYPANLEESGTKYNLMFVLYERLNDNPI